MVGVYWSGGCLILFWFWISGWFNLGVSFFLLGLACFFGVGFAPGVILGCGFGLGAI